MSRPSIVTHFFLTCSFSLLLANGIAQYTEQERNALDQFRAMAIDVLPLDYQKLDSFLIRFLRVKNFNVEEANKMIRSSMKWRKANNIDTITNETSIFNPPLFNLDGKDRDGRPILTFAPTRVNMRALIINGMGPKLNRYWDQALEFAELKLEEASKKSGGKLFQGWSLLDLQGFNIRQHLCTSCIGSFVNWVYQYENHHPDMAKGIVWINVPRAFIPILTLVKPLISNSSRQALKVFPPDRKEWSAYLLKYIPADQLEFRFGGTRNSTPGTIK